MSQDTKPDITITSLSAPSSLAGPSSAPLEHIFPFLQDQDEQLEISDKKNGSSVWALKIPRFLLERWEMIEERGVELGSLVVDNSTTPAKITLRLTHPDSKPSDGADDQDHLRKHTQYDTSGIPDEYKVNVPEERARNLYVFTEKKRVYGKDSTSVAMPEGAGEGEAEGVSAVGGRRKRHKAQPKLIAKVDHECQVTPMQNQKYIKILEQRRLESEQSKRPVMRMDDTGISQAEQNQLASGYRNAISTFGSSMISSAKTNNGERHARLERHELTDRIFSLFKEKPYWGIPALKVTLRQPDGWLREVLRDVAEQIREGKYVNMWQLKKSWRGDAKDEGTGEGEGEGEGDVKPSIGGDEEMGDGQEEEEEDEDEEDDFEEVMA
ncbi:hypothetical protein I302_108527 [Kwoniella bestiolae CBS 10118]|uniref:Transcription initiation factor IIF subunit beta n=1 Tax=Kwoniella bestiolae CBS 10118 TaxID=1296100 RepID=A0A1B9FVF2_9TREE|nr:hypothetical protein I302_07100 [Kwoniella bestiolae CBS 10118]OCF22759.1 hypothetical protein I302_07100 [Kwoniella bestiolae CBS 10118]